MKRVKSSIRLKKYGLLVGQYALPIILFCILVAQTRVRNIVEGFASLEFGFLAAAYGLFAVNLIVTSLRVRRISGSSVGLFKFFEVQCLGSFWANIAPGRAGEISFPILWNRNMSIPGRKGGAILILVRSIDCLLLSLSYFIGTLFMQGSAGKVSQKLCLGLLGGLAGLGIVLVIVLGLLGRRLKKVGGLLKEIRMQLQHIDSVIVVLSVLIICLRYAMLYAFLCSLGVRLSVLTLILMSFFLFLSKFVKTVGEFGTHELATTSALMMFGMSKGAAIALSLNVHVLQLIAVVAFGLWAYLRSLKRTIYNAGENGCVGH